MVQDDSDNERDGARSTVVVEVVAVAVEAAGTHERQNTTAQKLQRQDALHNEVGGQQLQPHSDGSDAVSIRGSCLGESCNASMTYEVNVAAMWVGCGLDVAAMWVGCGLDVGWKC
jgi:hypothetical protein